MKMYSSPGTAVVDLEQHFLDLPRQMNAEMSMSANLDHVLTDRVAS